MLLGKRRSRPTGVARMRCPSCGFDNPEGVKFCGQCGRLFKLHCPHCHSENPLDFSFCGECGAALGPMLQEKATQEAERRHLTIMFCDQEDSVGRSQRLELEDFREVTRQYQEMCAKVIRDFDGHIGQYQGDGLLVYFGYPSAHEDDAQRAVRAGLEILAELPHLNTRLQQTFQDLKKFPLRLRIGIHTGEAVVGKAGTGEDSEVIVLGLAPNLASRLQGIAEPDTVVISADTYRLTEGFFECQDLGLRRLKGVVPPVRVYCVLRESGAHVIEVREAAGLTPLVGRK